MVKISYIICDYINFNEETKRDDDDDCEQNMKKMLQINYECKSTENSDSLSMIFFLVIHFLCL